MTSPSRTRRLAVGASLVAAGAIGATVVTGLAFASDRSGPSALTTSARSVATSSADASSAVGGAAGRRAGMLRSLLHGEVTLAAGNATKVVDLQRGRITAVSASSLTVASTDGFTATYELTSGTVVRKARQVVAASTLAVGQEVLVRASSGTAAVVRTR